MNTSLQATFQSQLALQELEKPLLLQARVLYQKGFGAPHISATQMAAIGDLIEYAGTYEQAKSTISDFLKKQLKKLNAKEQRGEMASSWALTPQGGEAADTLGGTFQVWIDEERYLANVTPGAVNKLVVLRRFWSYFYGYYRYAAVVGREMPLVDA